MSAAKDPIKRLARRYAKHYDIPPEKLGDLENVLYIAISSDPERAAKDPAYLRSVLEAFVAYLHAPKSRRRAGPKRGRFSRPGWLFLFLAVTIIGGGLVFGFALPSVLPGIQSGALRLLVGGLSTAALLVMLFYARPVLQAALAILAPLWDLLGWLSRYLLPASVVLGLAVVPAINMAWISRPTSLLVASVVSTSVGVVSGGAIAKAARSLRKGWGLFVLATFCIVASTTWSFINLSNALIWDRIFPCIAVAFLLAIRVAMN